MDKKNRVKRFSKIYYGKRSKKKSLGALVVIYVSLFLFVATASYFVSMAINSYCRRPHCTKIDLSEDVYEKQSGLEKSDKNLKELNSNEKSKVQSSSNDEGQAQKFNSSVLKINGVEVDAKTLASSSAFEKFLKKVKADEKNAVVVCLKGEDGKLPFESNQKLANQWKTTASKRSIDFEEVVEKIKAEDLIPIARMSAFFDQTAPSVENENTFLYEKKPGESKAVVHVFGGGNGFKKGKWLDATNPDVRSYITELAVEITKMGFDRILVDNAWFPVFKSKYELSNFEEGACDADARYSALLKFVKGLNSSGVKAIFSYPGDVLFNPELSKSLFGSADLLDNFKYHAPIFLNESGIEKSELVFTKFASSFVFIPELYSNSKNINNMLKKFSNYEIESNFIVRNS